MNDKLTTIDLFAGAGGLSLGLEKAGFEHILLNEIDNNAAKTLQYNRKHWNVINDDIKNISLEEFCGFVDLLTFGLPCFRAGTKILTTNGYKSIEDIVIGDFVLTHMNRFKKVINIMKNPSESIFKINATGLTELYVTREHPFYILNKDQNKPIWKNAEDLDKGDFIGYQINQKSIIPKWNGIKTTVNQNKIKNKLNNYMDKSYFWWFVGRYIADGWLTFYRRKNRKNSFVRKVTICAGHLEKDDIEIELNKLNLHYTIVKEKTVYKYHYNNQELFEFLKQFKRYAHGKELNNIIYDLPVNLLKYFLKGYLSGDGSFNIQKKEHSFNTVSENLAYGLQNIVHKVYRTPCKLGVYRPKNKTIIIEGRTVNIRDTYYAKFFIDIERTKSFVKNNIIWSPFKRKELIYNKESVYNFEVDQDNSYTANNAIVHNCQSFSYAGKRLGLEDTRGTLFYEVGRIIKNTEPKMFLMENVKGLLTHDKGKTLETMMSVFKDLDYDVLEPVLLKGIYYNVPQKRERLFIIGIRKGLSNKPFLWPEPDTENIPTVQDAFFKGNLYDTDVPDSEGQSYSEKKLKVMKLVPEGGNWKDLPLEIQKEYMMKTFYSTGGRTGIAKRLSFSEPSLTILCSPSQKQTERCHPTEDRPLTIRESARIQTFPDDWLFSGSISSQYRQVGNAVPVNLAHQIGIKIKEFLNSI